MLCFLFVLFIFTPAVNAAEFDLLLQSEIDSRGVRKNGDGIIYAAPSEHNTMLTIISVEKKHIIIRLYGAENEPADTLRIPLGSHDFSLSITAPAEALCVSVGYSRKTEYYTLINDAFTLSAPPRGQLSQIAAWQRGRLIVAHDTVSVYDTLNNLKLRRADSLPLDSANFNDGDKEQIIRLLRACADIAEYDSRAYDIDELTRRVLYTHNNFTAVTKLDPKSSEANTALKSCSYDFIADAMHRAFRLEPKKPAVNMITELKYCFNNGYFYYSGGYSGYFLTTVGDIARAYEIEKDNLYIIFSDTFTDAEHEPFPEYSTATVAKDDDGFYIKSIHMGGDLSDLYEYLKPSEPERTSIIPYLLPILTVLAALAAIGTVIQLFLINPR